jgi:hypothetical protein
MHTFRKGWPWPKIVTINFIEIKFSCSQLKWQLNMHLGGSIFSPLGDKSSLPKGIFEFFGFCVPIMFHVCSHKVHSDIPHKFSMCKSQHVPNSTHTLNDMFCPKLNFHNLEGGPKESTSTFLFWGLSNV